MRLDDFIQFRVAELQYYFRAYYGRCWHRRLARALGYKAAPRWSRPGQGGLTTIRALRKSEALAMSLGFRPKLPRSSEISARAAPKLRDV
jgi:hypothetical protein